MIEVPGIVQSLAILLATALWVGSLVYRAKKARDKQRAQEAVLHEKLAGRDPAKLIEASPFSYSQREGEKRYQIIDERKDPPHVGFARSAEKAEKAILSRILFEEP